MSIRKENNGIDMGDPTKIAANHGTTVSTKSGPFNDGISEMPPLKGSNGYPKQGRIEFGMQKLNHVP
jgi:hypothetical protein